MNTFFISVDLYLKHHFKWLYDTLYRYIYFNNSILLKLDYVQHSYATDDIVLNVHMCVGMYIWTPIYMYISLCIFSIISFLCLVAQSCLFVTPWTVAHQAPLSMGILQTRILVWVAMPSSRGSFQLRDWTQVSRIAGEFFTVWATREAQLLDTEFIVQRIHSFLQEQELFLWSDVSFF